MPDHAIREGIPQMLWGGDGDYYVENNELVWIATPPYEVNWSWANYVDFLNGSHVRSDLPQFRYRFGLKTFVDFLLEDNPMYSETNNLWATPQQPLRAVK